MFVAEKVLLLLVISLIAYALQQLGRDRIGIYIAQKIMDEFAYTYPTLMYVSKWILLTNTFPTSLTPPKLMQTSKSTMTLYQHC